MNPWQVYWIRHQRAIVTVAAVLLTAGLAAGALAWAHVTVTVEADGRTLIVPAWRTSVAGALARAGVTLGPYDIVQPPADTPLEEGMPITVRRAVPLKVTADGETKTIHTTSPTVGEALAAAGIMTNEGNRVEPDPSTPVNADLDVRVVRVRQETVVVEQAIPFGVDRREDGSLELGLSRVVQAGRQGRKQVTLAVTYEDGEKVRSAVVDEQVVQQPVTQIVAVGTSGTISRGGQTIRFRKALEMASTAYYPGPESTGKYSDGYTSIGLKATYGVVAVDPRVIPLRSRLYIDGYGFAIAGDVGSAIKGNRIDLCFDTYEEAIRWGRRKVKVYILQ